ncbi:MAG: fructosamine-3-kinase [Granulosicoccus sp.]|jgi:fructosamine-3-kinase
MLELEARGLELLRTNSKFEIPRQILINEFGGKQFLALDWIEEGEGKEEFYKDFGRSLADLIGLLNNYSALIILIT